MGREGGRKCSGRGFYLHPKSCGTLGLRLDVLTPAGVSPRGREPFRSPGRGRLRQFIRYPMLRIGQLFPASEQRFLSPSQVLRDVGTCLARGQACPAHLGAVHGDVLAACPGCTSIVVSKQIVSIDASQTRQSLVFSQPEGFEQDEWLIAYILPFVAEARVFKHSAGKCAFAWRAGGRFLDNKPRLC